MNPNLNANFQAFQQFGKDQMEASASVAGDLAKTVQQIATEATDFSKQSFQTSSAYLEKLFSVRKFEDALKLQQDFAKESYETFVARATRFGELYSQLAKDAMKPVQGAVAQAQDAAKSVMTPKAS